MDSLKRISLNGKTQFSKQKRKIDNSVFCCSHLTFFSQNLSSFQFTVYGSFRFRLTKMIKKRQIQTFNVLKCSLNITQNFGSFVCWACGRSNCTEQRTWKRANIFLLAFFNKICRTWRTFLWNFDDSSAISKQNQNISQFDVKFLKKSKSFKKEIKEVIMTEYWKSQAKKFCDFCKCWISDNKAVSYVLFEQPFRILLKSTFTKYVKYHVHILLDLSFDSI